MVQSLMDYAPPETGLQPEEEDDEPKKKKTHGKRATKEMIPEFTGEEVILKVSFILCSRLF